MTSALRAQGLLLSILTDGAMTVEGLEISHIAQLGQVAFRTAYHCLENSGKVDPEGFYFLVLYIEACRIWPIINL